MTPTLTSMRFVNVGTPGSRVAREASRWSVRARQLAGLRPITRARDRSTPRNGHSAPGKLSKLLGVSGAGCVNVPKCCAKIDRCALQRIERRAFGAESSRRRPGRLKLVVVHPLKLVECAGSSGSECPRPAFASLWHAACTKGATLRRTIRIRSAVQEPLFRE